MPSRPISVTTKAPTPGWSNRAASATASAPVASAQPWIATSRPRASMPTATRPGCSRELVDELGTLHRRAPDHDARHAGREPVAGVLDGTNASAGLDLHRHVGADRLDHAEVRVSAVAGGVEIHHVDPPHATRLELARHRDGIVVVLRLAVVVALLELHDTTAADVDRRIEVHRHAAAAFTKLASSAKPTAPLFSGWNCVAQSGPRSIAAANRRP